MLSTAGLLLVAIVPSAMALNARADPGPSEALVDSFNMVKYVAWTWASIVGICLIFRWYLHLLHHIRRIANLNTGSHDGRQRYFSIPGERFASFKRHVLYAPFWRKRHHQEFRFSGAVNVGTLPGRLQSFFLLGYFVLNLTFCLWKVNYAADQWYQVAMQRTGILSVLNMIPLFLLAGRNNPLLPMLGIAYDTHNLIHRWIGRISIVEAVLHVAFWMYGKVHVYGAKAGWQKIAAAMGGSQMILTGTIGTAALLALLLHSPSAIRHAFYEVFLGVHKALALVTVVTVWMHLQSFDSAQRLLAGALIVWVIERAMRMYLLIRANYSRSKGVTKADVEALPGDALRVTLRVANPWKFRPGQHLYLYMPSIGMMSNHPFSIVWSESSSQPADEKTLPMTRQDIAAVKESTMSLIIRRRTGFTDKLWKRAEAKGNFTTTAFVEGPYGSENFQSYGTVMLFAAGVGITHQVPHIRDLVTAYSEGTCATRKVVLVWVIQSPEHLEWIRPWMTQILSMEKRRDILKILLFVTRPRSTKEIHSPSASVQMYPGKPDVGALISREQERQVGAMAVSVCGTGSLADDVRRAMRDRCEITEMDFYEEAFSW